MNNEERKRLIECIVEEGIPECENKRQVLMRNKYVNTIDGWEPKPFDMHWDTKTYEYKLSPQRFWVIYDLDLKIIRASYVNEERAQEAFVKYYFNTCELVEVERTK